MIVNTHATFRWRHGLFYAFDYDLMKQLDADLYVVLVDNIDRVQYRMARDGYTDHTLKDLMVWREEEMLATELLAHIVRGHGCFYVFARGVGPGCAEALARLICGGPFRTAYLSFPMSHVDGDADSLTEIERFRTEMKKYFICFDPGDLEEKPLTSLALAAAQAGRRHVRVHVDGRDVDIETSELLAIISDIDGQIYARDFKLIDSGVERELQHAHEAAKEVFVIWTSDATPSPFVTETATAVFGSVAEATRYFMDRGYVPTPGPGGLFG
ncbi:hypothetical protein LCGC14_2678610 [marine sediment metagenome]|uniref:Uncharacterized protein n=1 Tax=marine sediment metagenome TaxID=412755 RepID=A0A0F9BWW3_9ZZZZ